MQLELKGTRGRVARAAAEIKVHQTHITAEIQNARTEFDRQLQVTEKLLDRTETSVRILNEHLLNKGL